MPSRPNLRPQRLTERIQNPIDHAEVVVAVGVLRLDVNEVLRETVEPGGGQPQDRQRRAWLVAKEVERLRYCVHLDVRSRSYCRCRDPVEDHRHLAEHCAWGVNASERDAVARSRTGPKRAGHRREGRTQDTRNAEGKGFEPLMSLHS